MKKVKKSTIPDNISEEYYQINQAILASFPKYRPPLDLFRLKEEIGQLQVYSKKGTRLTNEQVEEIHALCAEGDLFVSRADHPIYSQHIVKQLDLVLVDQDLKDGEVADIILRACVWRIFLSSRSRLFLIFCIRMLWLPRSISGRIGTV